MYSPYRGRCHTKKQNNNCKLPISPEEKKIREHKKYLAKIFANIKFRQENKLNLIEISPQVNHRFKNGTYRSIFQHSLKQNPANEAKSLPIHREGFRGRPGGPGGKSL